MTSHGSCICVVTHSLDGCGVASTAAPGRQMNSDRQWPPGESTAHQTNATAHRRSGGHTGGHTALTPFEKSLFPQCALSLSLHCFSAQLEAHELLQSPPIPLTILQTRGPHTLAMSAVCCQLRLNTTPSTRSSDKGLKTQLTATQPPQPGSTPSSPQLAASSAADGTALLFLIPETNSSTSLGILEAKPSPFSPPLFEFPFLALLGISVCGSSTSWWV